MKKLNWSCNICGMSSGRKYSVRRHISNYNIHNGTGNIIPFVEYAVGRREGKYQAQIPGFRRSQSNFLNRIFAKISEELENQIAKDIAMRILQDLYAEQVPLNDLKALAITYLVKNNFFRFFKESMS